jgi:hypothetical protein
MVIGHVTDRNTVAKNFTIDLAAAQLLEELAPGRKQLGRYISMLIYQEYSRREERARLKAALTQAWQDDAPEVVAHA